MRTGARYPAVEDAPARTCLPIPVTAERLRSGHRVPSWPPGRHAIRLARGAGGARRADGALQHTQSVKEEQT
jgi:hypothetical protein